MWELDISVLWVYTACYRDNFTFYFFKPCSLHEVHETKGEERETMYSYVVHIFEPPREPAERISIKLCIGKEKIKDP
jgi:hypothetical protein